MAVELYRSMFPRSRIPTLARKRERLNNRRLLCGLIVVCQALFMKSKILSDRLSAIAALVTLVFISALWAPPSHANDAAVIPLPADVAKVL
jgi:hypothetical protein